MASLSPLPDMTCILSCRIPGPRAETATKINRLSIYMYNPRVDMRPGLSHKILVFERNPSYMVAQPSTFLQSITIYFAEHDHRLKIENVVVADQSMRSLLSHAGVIRQRHPFLINWSILSCRQIVDLESI